MDTNDDLNGKELSLKCFYMHTIFEKKIPQTSYSACLVINYKNDLKQKTEFLNGTMNSLPSYDSRSNGTCGFYFNP